MKLQNLYFATTLTLSTLGLTLSAQATSLPDCDHAGVLSRVSKNIAISERNVVQSGDPITSLHRISQRKLLENGPRSIAQRFCSATGYTASGKKKSVYYLIEANAGFVGYNYAVETCIMGRDPRKIHGAYCRSVR